MTEDDAAEKGSRFGYKLALEVSEHGDRTFTATAEADDQSDMASGLAFDIHRMLRIMDAPPTTGEIVEALEGGDNSVFYALAVLYRCWDVVNDFEDAFSVEVDLHKLVPDGEEEERDEARRAVKRMGWTIKGEDA